MLGIIRGDEGREGKRGWEIARRRGEGGREGGKEREGKRREGKGRERKKREGKGREEKGKKRADITAGWSGVRKEDKEGR